MLHTISWSSFLSFLFVSLIIYYIVVLLLYYRKDFKWQADRLTPNKPAPLTNQYPDEQVIKTNSGVSSRMEYSDFISDEEKSTISNSTSPDHNQINEIVHELLDEIKTVFENIRGSRIAKETLCDFLKSVMRRYDVLANSSIIHELNAHLIAECENNCSITLSEAEIMRLWKD